MKLIQQKLSIKSHKLNVWNKQSGLYRRIQRLRQAKI